MTEPTVKDRVTQMARDVLGPHMKAAGFRRKGRVFWRNNETVCQLVTLDMNRFGTRDSSSLRVLLGTFWHDVERIRENKSFGKLPPPEYRCTFRLDLAWAVPNPPLEDWDVTYDTDYTAIGNDVWKKLRGYGVPYLEYRSDLSRTLEFRRYSIQESKNTYVAHELISADAVVVFKAKLGKLDEAKQDLLEFVKNGHRENAIALAQQLNMNDGVVNELRSASSG